MARKSAIRKSTVTEGRGTGNLTRFMAEEEQRQKLVKAAARVALAKRGKLQRITQQELDDDLFPTCTWDLETSNLNASIGFLLCAVIKPWKGTPKIFRIDQSPRYDKDRSNDQWLAMKIKEELERYTIAIAYNGQRFDVPYLNTRLMLANVRPIVSTVKHLDPIYASRFRMRMHSNRLETLVETFNLRAKKTPLNGNIWIRAAVGVKRAMDTVVTHCVKDTYALEAVAKILAPLIDQKYYLVR